MNIKGLMNMPRDWYELTQLTRGAPVIVERVRLADSNTAIEGSFELPPLARLPAEDQVFIMAFVRSHGSIKEMERVFGISYPTVKNRLEQLAQQFEFVEINPLPSRSEVLQQLADGVIDTEEALRRLSK